MRKALAILAVIISASVVAPAEPDAAFPRKGVTGAGALAVAKDAVVATVNRKNPFLAEIQRRGLRRDEFLGIWIKRSVSTWEGALGRNGRNPPHAPTPAHA